MTASHDSTPSEAKQAPRAVNVTDGITPASGGELLPDVTNPPIASADELFPRVPVKPYVARRGALWEWLAGRKSEKRLVESWRRRRPLMVLRLARSGEHGRSMRSFASLGKSVISRRSTEIAYDPDALLPGERLPSIEIYADIVKVKVPRVSAAVSPSKRGRVCGASVAALRRQREALAQVRDFRGCVFGTATYPSEYPASSEDWKDDYEALWKRITRKWPYVGQAWRLEFQKRGAPHFHDFILKLHPGDDSQIPLAERAVRQEFVSDRAFCHKAEIFVRYLRLYLLRARARGHSKLADKLQRLLSDVCEWRLDWLHAFRIWYAWAWYEIAGGGDCKHLLMGTDAQYVESRRQAQYYLTKYITKEPEQRGVDDWGECCDVPDREKRHTGRVWGLRGAVDRSLGMRVYLTPGMVDRLRVSFAMRLAAGGSAKARAYAQYILANDVRGSTASGGVRVAAASSFTVFGVGDESSRELVNHLLDLCFDERW